MTMRRRDFLRLSGMAAAAFALGAAEKPQPARRNILFIMADQFRFEWIGARGARFLRTPNLDALAANGVLFTRAVSNSPVCASSRVSLAAGVYGNRLGAYANGSAFYPAQANGFPELLPSFYNVLAANGYRTGIAGKCDLSKGRPPKLAPGQQASVMTSDSRSGFPLTRELGFTDSWVIPKWSGEYLQQLFGRKDLREIYREDEKKRALSNPSPALPPCALPDEFSYEHVLGRKAVEVLDTFHKEDPTRPWFFHVNFHSPHPPHDAPRQYLDMYEGVEFPPPAVAQEPNRNRTARKNITSAILHRIQQHYAAMITLDDEWIGKLIATLKKNGQYENTVILFSSDHGEMLGDFGLFAKNQMYEGSLRVPLIISGPGVTARGQSRALAELVDLYPTILDLAGLGHGRAKLDGKSLAPLLAGKSREHKEYQYSEWGPLTQPPYAQRRMVFDGRYKLIDAHASLELYDLDADPHETRNLADKNGDTVTRLKAVMNSYSQGALPPQAFGSDPEAAD